MTKTAMLHNGRILPLINKYILHLNSKKFISLFFILFSMGLAYSFPIWLADRTYIDDLGRSIGGYTQWEIAGRPFASWLTSIANFQYPWSAWSGVPPKLPDTGLLVDTSPFLQILSRCNFSIRFSLTWLYNSWSRGNLYYSICRVFSNYWKSLLLENLSYKFDALSMTTALAISITAAINPRNKLLDLAIGTLVLIIAYGLYQPSVNAFIGTSALLTLADLWNKKVFVRNIAYLNITKFAIATIIYKIGIITLFPPTTPYVISHSQLIPITTEGLATLADNIATACARILEFFVDIPVLSILGIVSVVVFGARASWQGRTHEKITNFAVFVVGATILTFSICESYFFKKSVFSAENVYRLHNIFSFPLIFLYSWF